MNTLKSLYNKKWFRVIMPTLAIVIWFAIGGIGGPTFGKISDVSTNDQASFLPASAESTKAAELQKKFYSSDTLPAIIVIESSTKLTPTQLANLAKLQPKLQSVDGVSNSTGAVVGPIPSSDAKAVEFIVQVKSDSEIGVVVAGMRSILNETADSSLKTYVTGPAGLSADLVSAFGGIDGVLLLVALIAVFVILLLVYRSILLPFVVLLSAMFALTGAILLIYQLALHDVIKLNGQSQGILSILVIGAATDYSLLFIARYKEALHYVNSKWDALLAAYRGAFEPILASAVTVVAALLCLLFSDLNSNRSLGPIAAIGIVLAFISSMTLLPALLAILGRKAFWPVMPKYDTKQSKKDAVNPRSLWGRIGSLVEAHARRIWIVSTVVLLACTLGVMQLKANGTDQSATLLNPSNAVDGQSALSRHFSAGSGSPAAIIVNKAEADKVVNIATNTPGVGDVMLYTGAAPFVSQPPKIVDGEVLINATLTSAADSPDAANTVLRLREDLAAAKINAVVGGESATMLDTNTTAKEDLYKIVPIVLVVILVILMLLLRSVLSAVILIASVILSYFATLGISAIVFNHLFGFPGSDPSVPLFGFIFLVALGVDYNIFLMTRVREEAMRKTTKKAILHALEVTGGVITSAGIVLAATFAALGIIPILFLAQIAFTVSFGVLLDTIVVRSLLLSSLTYDIGSKIWWPSGRAKKS